MNDEKRFWERVEKTPTCWIWQGAKAPYGHWSIWTGTKVKTILAHRYAYQLVKGPIPEGKTLDHLCKNIICVNPDHLEPVTQRENNLRGDGFAAREARQTHCKRGHPLIAGNLRLDKLKVGKRTCLTCSREDTTRHNNLRRALHWFFAKGVIAN